MNASLKTVLPLIAALLFIAGCGGEDPPAANGNAQNNNQEAAPPPAPKGGGENAPKVETPKPPPQKMDKALANADPNDIFVREDKDNPNFLIVDDGNDTFIASVPESGVDSTQFVAIPPREDRSAEPPPAQKSKLPAGFTPILEAGYSAEGFALQIRCDKDGAAMAFIPASISPQGSNDGPPNAQPQIAAFVDPYYMDVAEVTLAQYVKFRDAWKEEKTRTVPLPMNHGSPEDLPALGVAWADARNYADWAGKTLPTEAEWEKAARGPDGLLHPWGNGRAGWHPPRELRQIDPIMSFRADISPYGIYDLAGNAREWCEDYYSPEAYQEATRGGETVVRNFPGPKRALVANHRVVRGNGPGWMAWHRGSAHMRDSAPDIGFRCVLRVGSKEDKPASGTPPRPATGF